MTQLSKYPAPGEQRHGQVRARAPYQRPTIQPHGDVRVRLLGGSFGAGDMQSQSPNTQP